MATDSCKTKLQNLLAMLRAVQIVHHTAHWQTKGPTFAGDHKLYAKLYAAIDDEYDTLAEKMVAKYGVDVVDATDQLRKISTVVSRAVESDSDLPKRSLNCEVGLQSVLEAVRDYLRQEKQLSMGMDNFLQGLADSHESAVYKLKQRTAK